MFFEFGQFLRPAVVVTNEIGLGQVEDRLSGLVRDEDLDELERDADLMLEGFLRPNRVLGGRINSGRGDKA
ncbi:MAG: hypothetical protein NTU60_09555 [Candidatus Aminicenantes bacterium]|nr:hypothetical protein [Candidatus Aminicenantes bacterium]